MNTGEKEQKEQVDNTRKRKAGELENKEVEKFCELGNYN